MANQERRKDTGANVQKLYIWAEQAARQNDSPSARVAWEIPGDLGQTGEGIPFLLDSMANYSIHLPKMPFSPGELSGEPL